MIVSKDFLVFFLAIVSQKHIKVNAHYTHRKAWPCGAYSVDKQGQGLASGFFVGRGRLELPRLAALGPKPSVSTISPPARLETQNLFSKCPHQGSNLGPSR